MSDPAPDVDSRKAKLDQLTDQWLDAKAGIDKHTDNLKAAAEQLIGELGVGGRHETVPGVGVRVQAPSMMFNAAKARVVLTDEQYDSICERKPSVELAERMLPGALVDQCKLPQSKPSLRRL